MRLLGTKLGSISTGRGLGDSLYDTAAAVPSLDLQFADRKSLVDGISGQNLITFTRATTGTFVDSQGVIRNATTNLLLRSEEFDNAAWTKTNANVTANAVTAPNGTLTADALIEDTANGLHRTFNGWTSVASVPYVGSFYVKAAGRTKVDAEMRTTSTAGSFTFDLLAGTVSGTVPNQTASITNVGDGWFRCSVAVSAAGVTAGASLLLIYLNNGTFNSYTGNGTSGIYLWGAQLEQSSTVGEYVPTGATINSAPRFDHNPTTGECLGLLVEEQRTNLLLRSEEIGTSPWATNNPGATTYTANAIAAPTGAVTADRVTATADFAGPVQFVSVTSGLSYSFSFYVKAVTPGSLDSIRIECFSGRFVTFNITTRAFSSNPAITPSSVSLGDGWVRVQCLFAAPSTGSLAVAVYSSTSSDFYLWGAQLEAGAFPTSYIPTTGSAATRNADVVSITGSNFSSWYRQDEGSFFCSTFAPKGAVIFGTGDTFDNAQYVTRQSSLNVSFRSGGVTQAILSAPISSTANTSAAIAYAVNSFAAVSNAGAVSTGNNGDVPAGQVRLKIGSSSWDVAASNNVNGHISRLTYWPRRLPNAALQAITQ